MTYGFMQQHRSTFGVERMCRLLGVSRSGYYAGRRRAPSARSQANTALLGHIHAVHAQSRTRYGSPRVTHELRAQGHRCGRHRVARLMRAHGVVGKVTRRFKRTTRPARRPQAAPNLVPAPFASAGPNRVWVTDITYLATQEGWLYLAVLVDVWSRLVVGWALHHRLTDELVCTALRHALHQRLPGPGFIVHSDRGSQYTSTAWATVLTAWGGRASMSATGHCYDNALAESFFHTLKGELGDGTPFPSRAAASDAVFEYIAVFYNRQRRHSALGYLAPATFEDHHHAA